MAGTLNGWAAIDEKKGRRVCEEIYSGVKLPSAVDILAHGSVGGALSRDEMATAILGALVDGNMQVHPQDMDWVPVWIDPANISMCRSLPAKVRERHRSRGAG